jgi:teichuronic acid biosynthesis glycosyltransferase TuaC
MLASSYPRRSDDSASIFLRHLAEHLHDRGLSVHVLTPADDIAGASSENGVMVRRFRYFPGAWQRLAYGSGILPNLERNPLLWAQVPFFVTCMATALVGAVHKLRPHIVHAHWVIPQGLVAVLAKQLYRTPILVTAHGGDAFALRNVFLQKAKIFALRRANAWSSNTSETAKAVAAGSPVPAPHIIPMGVNVKHFAAGKREQLRKDIPPHTTIVLFVGRLVEKKGVDQLIRAYSLLGADSSQNTRLWIIGDGEQRTTLEALATELGVGHQTTFWGRVPNDRLPDYYAAADLFVGPSVVAASGDTEGQGVVFLEAFASRVCVVASKIGGIAEVVEDGRTGTLVNPGQPEHLARAMKTLLSDQRLRRTLASNAYESVKDKYDWPNVARDFENLYRQIEAGQR